MNTNDIFVRSRGLYDERIQGPTHVHVFQKIALHSTLANVNSGQTRVTFSETEKSGKIRNIKSMDQLLEVPVIC